MEIGNNLYQSLLLKLKAQFYRLILKDKIVNFIILLIRWVKHFDLLY